MPPMNRYRVNPAPTMLECRSAIMPLTVSAPCADHPVLADNVAEMDLQRPIEDVATLLPVFSTLRRASDRERSAV